MAQICWTRTRQEARGGGVPRPRPVTGEALRSAILPPRFVIKKSRGVPAKGLNEPKHRPSDNLEASKINPTGPYKATYAPQGLNFASCVAGRCSNWRMKNAELISRNFQQAYTHLSNQLSDVEHVKAAHADPETVR